MKHHRLDDPHNIQEDFTWWTTQRSSALPMIARGNAGAARLAEPRLARSKFLDTTFYCARPLCISTTTLRVFLHRLLGLAPQSIALESASLRSFVPSTCARWATVPPLFCDLRLPLLVPADDSSVPALRSWVPRRRVRWQTAVKG